MSGLMFVSTRPSESAAPLAALVPIIPSTSRQFSSGDRVRAFLRVYQGLARSVMPGYVTAQIRDADDRVVFKSESRVTPEQFGAGRGSDLAIDVPASQLGRGEYLLTVDAVFGNETAHRDARFHIQ